MEGEESELKAMESQEKFLLLRAEVSGDSIPSIALDTWNLQSNLGPYPNEVNVRCICRRRPEGNKLWQIMKRKPSDKIYYSLISN